MSILIIVMLTVVLGLCMVVLQTNSKMCKNLMNKHEESMLIINDMNKQIKIIKVENKKIKAKYNELSIVCSQLQNECSELRDENRRIVRELQNCKLISKSFTLNQPFAVKLVK